MSANNSSSTKMTENHQAVFDLAMDALDSHYAPPLLWSSAKLSSWYAVGLLQRGSSEDISRANKLLRNALTMQDLDPEFEQNYGS
jgi:hypothetical protein